MVAVETWLYPRDEGLYCAAGDFFVDPLKPVDRALITHGHSDHARPGHGTVLATPETLAIMRARLGERHAQSTQSACYRSDIRIGDATVRFVPAGHVLGSAQIVIDHAGKRAVVSGDYKRVPDPTCASFEPVRCDVFVSEATFGLPVFRHPPPMQEIARLLASVGRHPKRTHLVGVYGLGKCQRVLRLIRDAGYEAPIYLHEAHRAVTELYRNFGLDFGVVKSVVDAAKEELAGAIVLCPPSASSDRWSRRFEDPVTAVASGWMRVRARARQRGAELPLIISDHADWSELLATIVETEAEETWITHGREDALIHQLGRMGRRARALSLVGFEDDPE